MLVSRERCMHCIEMETLRSSLIDVMPPFNSPPIVIIFDICSRKHSLLHFPPSTLLRSSSSSNTTKKAKNTKQKNLQSKRKMDKVEKFILTKNKNIYSRQKFLFYRCAHCLTAPVADRNLRISLTARTTDLKKLKLTSTKNFYNFSFRLLSTAAAVAGSSHHRGKRKSALVVSLLTFGFHVILGFIDSQDININKNKLL